LAARHRARLTQKLPDNFSIAASLLEFLADF